MKKIEEQEKLDKKDLIPVDKEAFTKYSDQIFKFFKADVRRKRAKKDYLQAKEEYETSLAEEKELSKSIMQIVKDMNSDDSYHEEKYWIHSTLIH